MNFTVLELLTKTTGFFEKKLIDSPRYNAEMLLAMVLKCRRIDLYLMFDKPVGSVEVDAYRDLIKKRAENVPLQYLLGSVEFYNVSLQVNASALIPRQETETLIEQVIEDAKTADSCRILDIGSGSGNIPVALGHNLINAQIVSVDVSPDALHLAKENAAVYNLAGRVEFHCIDVFTDAILNLGSFDYIVSNPPYVSVTEFATLQAEIVKYEPRMAVTDEGDGMRFYKRITEVGRTILHKGGKLLFEAGKDQSDGIKDLMLQHGYKDILCYKDLLGIERVVKGTSV